MMGASRSTFALSLMLLIQVIFGCYRNLAVSPKFGWSCVLELEGLRINRRVTGGKGCLFEQDIVNKSNKTATVTRHNCLAGEIFNLDICECASMEKTSLQTCRTQDGHSINELRREQMFRYADTSLLLPVSCDGTLDKVYVDYYLGDDVCTRYWTDNYYTERVSSLVKCADDELFAMGVCACVDRTTVHASNCTLKQ